MIRPATLVDVLRVASALPDDEKAQIVASVGHFDAQETAARMYAQPGARFAICVPDSGEVVAVGGWSPLRESLLQSWMLVTRAGWQNHGFMITRDTRRLTDRLFVAPVRRMQTMCLASRAKARRWYEVLGLEPESVLRGFGVNGEDFAMHSRVREVTDVR